MQTPGPARLFFAVGVEIGRLETRLSVSISWYDSRFRSIREGFGEQGDAQGGLAGPSDEQAEARLGGRPPGPLLAVV
jgi:hypothetical protein